MADNDKLAAEAEALLLGSERSKVDIKGSSNQRTVKMIVFSAKPTVMECELDRLRDSLVKKDADTTFFKAFHREDGQTVFIWLADRLHDSSADLIKEFFENVVK